MPNPTAPTVLVEYLSGDFTDSDGDGMTDAAELRYGFNPHDSGSFPPTIGPITLPPLPTINITVAPPTAPNINPYLEVGARTPSSMVGILTLHFAPPPTGSIALMLQRVGSTNNLIWEVVNDGFLINTAAFGASTNDSLSFQLTHYGTDGQFQSASEVFTLPLATVSFPLKVLGTNSNQLGFTFVPNFPYTAQTQYVAFISRVLPIMNRQLGPPAESFNILFDDTGAAAGTFMSINNGRGVDTDGTFIPRLIVHELTHAWHGAYLLASDTNWNYSTDLSGFEEGLAEGMAFSIVKEYVRSYPNDPATIQLMNSKPYQYWNAKANVFDSIKNMRVTGAGDFFCDGYTGDYYLRYQTSAALVEMLEQENPDFIRLFHAAYYDRINTDTNWRPNREDLITMFSAEVPQLHAQALREVMDSMPVFNGHKLDPGFYIENEIRAYGGGGDFQFAPLYIKGDGSMMWASLPGDLTGTNALPPWLPTVTNGVWVYVNTQNSPVDIVVHDSTENIVFTNFYHTSEGYATNGAPLGNGWFMASDLHMENFQQGLYRTTVTMEQFIPYDPGAREDYYFFGIQGLNQDNYNNEYVIMVGVNGVSTGTVQITLQGTNYTASLVNGAAWFRSMEWPVDMRGNFAITVTDTQMHSHTYQRNLIECGSLWGYLQQQFIIIDRDFDGVEDMYNTTPLGSLTVTLTPAGAVSAGAQWQVDGGAWQPNGAAIAGLRGGSHTVHFNRIIGWTSPGDQTVSIANGATTTAVGTYVTVDTTPPTLTILSPSDYQTFTNAGITVTGTASDASGIKSVTVNGAAATLSGTNWSQAVTLALGTNTITVIATGNSANANTATQTVHAVQIPAVPLAPVAGFSASPTNGVVPLVVNFTDASTGTITSRTWTFGDGGTSSAVNPSNTYSTVGVYSPSLTVVGLGGSNTLVRPNLITVTSTNVSPDTTPPVQAILSPADYQTFRNANLVVSGTASDASGILSVTVDGAAATLSGSNWWKSVTIAVGTNTITVIATDNSAAMNSATQVVHAMLSPASTNQPPVIVVPPTVTIALLCVQNVCVVVAGETNVYDVGAADSEGNPLSYQWSFGDGATSVWSTLSTATHAYSPTSCGPYAASVTVTDGSLVTSSNLWVAVACQLSITKLQGTLNFAKINADSCTVKGTFSLPATNSFVGKLVTLDIGEAEVSFTLGGKGSGRNGLSLFNKPTYNKKTGLWTFSATLKNGSWQAAWAEYGMTNSTILKPGVLVTNFPVILVLDTETFMGTTNLHYTATAGKSGTAK